MKAMLSALSLALLFTLSAGHRGNRDVANIRSFMNPYCPRVFDASSCDSAQENEFLALLKHLQKNLGYPNHHKMSKTERDQFVADLEERDGDDLENGEHETTHVVKVEGELYPGKTDSIGFDLGAFLGAETKHPHVRLSLKNGRYDLYEVRLYDTFTETWIIYEISANGVIALKDFDLGRFMIDGKLNVVLKRKDSKKAVALEDTVDSAVFTFIIHESVRLPEQTKCSNGCCVAPVKINFGLIGYQNVIFPSELTVTRTYAKCKLMGEGKERKIKLEQLFSLEKATQNNCYATRSVDSKTDVYYMQDNGKVGHSLVGVAVTTECHCDC